MMILELLYDEKMTGIHQNSNQVRINDPGHLCANNCVFHLKTVTANRDTSAIAFDN